jgi:hypothetical protein
MLIDYKRTYISVESVWSLCIVYFIFVKVLAPYGFHFIITFQLVELP